jgi:hypothetical protein
MIIADSDSDEDATANDKILRVPGKRSIDEQLGGAAYRDTLVSVDGFTRNPNGTIKFHKDTKKRRKEEMEMGDMDLDAPEEQSKSGFGPERTKKRKEARVGQEFKAKARNASVYLITTHTFLAGWRGCKEEWGGPLCLPDARSSGRREEGTREGENFHSREAIV